MNLCVKQVVNGYQNQVPLRSVMLQKCIALFCSVYLNSK